MQGSIEEYEYQHHFIKWTPRTSIKSKAAPENHHFNAKTFDLLKSVIYKAFAQLPAAREAFCSALTEFNRLTTLQQTEGAT